MRICADGLVHCSTLHWDSQNHRHDGLHVPRYVLSIRDGYIDLTSTNKDPLFSSPRAKRFQYLFAIVAVDGHAIQMAAQQDPSSAHVRLEVSAEDLQAVEKTVNDFIEEILRHTGIPSLECSTCGTDLKRVRDIARHPTVAIVMCRPCLAWWHLENDLAPKIEKRCFLCMETEGRGESIFMNCKTCERLYCSGCVTRILGDGGVHQVLSEPEWGCFVCNERLTTSLRAQMFEFLDLAALNGHDMQCDHTIETQCTRQSIHIARTGSESVSSTSDLP